MFYSQSQRGIPQKWLSRYFSKIRNLKNNETQIRAVFLANQDIPGNIYWEELFHASPNAKVIMTVRDSTQVWSRSLTRFMEQETSRHGNPGFWLFNRFMSLGWTSPNIKNMLQISEFIMKNHFFRNCFVKTFPADWRILTWQRQNELIMPYWQAMEDNYEAQIRRVKVFGKILIFLNNSSFLQIFFVRKLKWSIFLENENFTRALKI